MENLTQVYEDSDGPRGERRESLTINQRSLLWHFYARHAYGRSEEPPLSAARRKVALTALINKGMVKDGEITEKGISYAKRLR